MTLIYGSKMSVERAKRGRLGEVCAFFLLTLLHLNTGLSYPIKACTLNLRREGEISEPAGSAPRL